MLRKEPWNSSNNELMCCLWFRQLTYNYLLCVIYWVIVPSLDNHHQNGIAANQMRLFCFVILAVNKLLYCICNQMSLFYIWFTEGVSAEWKLLAITIDKYFENTCIWPTSAKIVTCAECNRMDIRSHLIFLSIFINTIILSTKNLSSSDSTVSEPEKGQHQGHIYTAATKHRFAK